MSRRGIIFATAVSLLLWWFIFLGVKALAAEPWQACWEWLDGTPGECFTSDDWRGPLVTYSDGKARINDLPSSDAYYTSLTVNGYRIDQPTPFVWYPLDTIKTQDDTELVVTQDVEGLVVNAPSSVVRHQPHYGNRRMIAL